MASDPPSLRFTPLQSFVESSFFTQLAHLKLEKYKLDDSTREICGFQSPPSKLNKFDDKPILRLDDRSFATGTKTEAETETETDSNAGAWSLVGSLTNVNTIEEFKAINKQDLLNQWGRSMAESMQNTTKFDYDTFNRFSMISFSDLKKYKFYYWVAFPTLQSSWEITRKSSVDEDLLKLIISEASGEAEAKGQFYQLSDNKLLDSFSQDKDLSCFVFFDSCLSSDRRPSAQLKNYLYFLAYKGIKNIRLVVYRNNYSSFSLDLQLMDLPQDLKIVGWERTSQGKLGPKLADLSQLSNPRQLASQAVDLNLRLMRWRIAPELELDVIKNQKVLLLGAGTLGSYVARALLGWGVRDISIVDSGRVSYSNPVRQSLFNFEDCFSEHGRGGVKATTAADNLKRIFPGVDAKGFELEVPMIGHPITDEETQAAQYQNLNRLFDESDVVFLLMDSRESRWLPTVMGAAKGKTVINAALGFDSYLVMRHGSVQQDQGSRLGCYFCNDIVAPEDSLSDRTLDQMCTVTRPGGALVASSLAVELLVSLLQHPDKQNAKHDGSSKFGATPHQIRGFLHSFTQSKFHAPNYAHCAACSTKVIAEYKQRGWQFVKQCLNEAGYLEDLSGLKQVQEEAELAARQLLSELELDEGDGDDEDENKGEDEDEEWIS
ncbi:uncharacterized protein LODBEIA_P17430 [Lodderomyces beijingensis]|uniref:Ubiquitin-like modifier-activating enzyme ATG7 n=1 Tax=Lodderomyces beijingensis TaxID=1775926 RepID=A0ABP0ZI13_9ASCO